MKRIRLGELLLEKKLVTEETLAKASELQKKTGKKLGHTLIEIGAIKEEALLRLLAEQLSLPFIDLHQYPIDVKLVALLPETYARRYRAVILNEKDNTLLVGVADPLDIYAVDELTKILPKPIKLAIICESELLTVLDRVYRRTEEISHFAEALSGEMAEEKAYGDFFTEGDENEDAPVVKLLLSLFKDAVQSRASDVHIEPDEKVLRIRLRVDGLLQENVLEDTRIVGALIQRLKLRAHLDISEKRIPQDGRFNLALMGKVFDVRISTMPTAHGESVVMRLLDQSSPIVDLTSLGLPASLIQQLTAIFTRPYGMLLVTGPTGSGKTTTLYSILNQLNKAEKKIVTVEDPVEYRMSRINQVQVNPKIGLDFARVLRTTLRHDPDIIMVGEIRDLETAQIALRAAVTGHFVLATLHTNDAISTAMRLIDMGSEGFMVATAVKGILAQRLLRLICRSCKEDHVVNDDEKTWLATLEVKKQDSFQKGKGCSHCHFTGYHGRVGVYELLVFNKAMLDALRHNDTVTFTEEAMKNTNYTPLSVSVLALLNSGQTTIEEAIRVLGVIEEEQVV